MAKQSAGILLYREGQGGVEVLLVHPGGPLWASRDRNAWSIPKGEAEEGEDLLARALTELAEETGVRAHPPFHPLPPVRQSNKTVHAWAARAEGAVKLAPSNTFRMEWPPRSAKIQEFPEVDRAEWFDLKTAREKLVKAQGALIDALETRLKQIP